MQTALDDSFLVERRDDDGDAVHGTAILVYDPETVEPLLPIADIPPRGHRFVYRDAEYVRASFEGLQQSLLVGAVLAFVVLLTFLSDFRSPIVAGLSIPISIVVTFGALYFGGVKLNLMSLGEEEALAQGVDAPAITRSSLLWAAWITGFAVAVAGPVGFVGIIVPHAVRLEAARAYCERVADRLA